MIKAISFKPLANYLLAISFSTGKKIFDLKPYLNLKFYEPLKDVNLFKQVHVGEFTIEWANGCDIAPHELYDNSYTA